MEPGGKLLFRRGIPNRAQGRNGFCAPCGVLPVENAAIF